MRLTIGWCTFFERPGSFSRFLIRDLSDAYRPPALFASAFSQRREAVELWMGCDDELDPSSLAGVQDGLSSDILYLSSHGQFKDSKYHVLLNKNDWVPTDHVLGSRILVLDTGELAMPGVDWAGRWQAPGIGTDLRLVLGFEGLATGDRASARRGQAFAEGILDGLTFVEAWFAAVRQTSMSSADKPVALALGTSDQDADDILKSASLENFPPPRIGSAVSARVRP